MVEKTQIRVRYNETDSMRYLYHGNYASYYHASRTELLRKVGLSDRELECQGIILPIIDMKVKYLNPAFYDDLLIVKTTLNKMTACKLIFHYEITNQKEEIINRGETTLAYVNKSTRKPIVIPQEIKNKLQFLVK